MFIYRYDEKAFAEKNEKKEAELPKCFILSHDEIVDGGLPLMLVGEFEAGDDVRSSFVNYLEEKKIAIPDPLEIDYRN